MDIQTGYFMNWIKNRQTKYPMDWPFGGKYEKDTLSTGLTEGKTNWRLYGLVYGKMGWILIFMDWPTNGTTLQVATILVTMPRKILKLAT